MLTIISLLFLISVVFVTQNSCKKDSDNPNTSSIKGLWEGTMTDANTQPFFLSLKTNGTCTLESMSPGTQENLGYGTWTLNGTSLVCNLTCVYGYPTNVGLKMTYTGTYDAGAKTLKGNFHLVAPAGATDDGTFSLTKTN